MEKTEPVETIETIQKSRWFINRNFTLLWIGRTISITGDFFFSTTMILWFTTGIAKGQVWAPLAISGVALAETIPILVVGPIAGVFVDRWDKRRTMLLIDILRSVLIALLLLTTGLGVLPLLSNGHIALSEQLASIYTVIVLASMCAQFFNPARSALVRDIVPAQQLTKASSSMNIALNVALILGPTLAAPLFFAFGAQWAILIDALSFVVSFGFIFAIRAPEAARSVAKGAKGNYFHEFAAGLHFFRGNHVLVVILVTGIILSLGTGVFNALYLFFVVQNLHTPVSLAGLFASTYGLAVIVGSIFAVMLTRRIGEGKMLGLAIGVWGLLLLIFARMTSFLPGLVLFALLGLANAGSNVVVGPLKWRVTPREFIGRVEAAFTPMIIASQMVSVTIAGYLAGTVLNGLHATFLGMVFTPVDTIFTGAGILVLCAGVYALVAMRGVKIELATDRG
ncbi:MAG: MFS transporter [Ktedonobacteraceae bacterium]